MSDRFIITGGAGFIGNNIAHELNRRGHRDILIVDELDHDEKFTNLDGIEYCEYLDKNAFRSLLLEGKIRPVDTVFHMGACSSTTETNEEYLTDNNVRYSQQICEWCLENNIRFIYASSAATYGDGSLGYSDNDSMTPKFKPLNLYGKSKHDFDLWALKNGFLDRITGLKYFNVYGPYEDHKGDMRSVINKAYKQILETGKLTLFKSYRSEYADGEQERDFIFIRDVVNVTLFFHDNQKASGLFNCGTGQARTWLDLARAIFAAMNRESVITFTEMPETIRDKYQYHTKAEIAKLRNTGYTSDFTSIEEGTRLYVQQYLAGKYDS